MGRYEIAWAVMQGIYLEPPPPPEEGPGSWETIGVQRVFRSQDKADAEIRRLEAADSNPLHSYWVQQTFLDYRLLDD